MRLFTISSPHRLLASILLPTALAVLLLFALIYAVVLPAFEQAYIDGKKTAIRELVRTASSIVEEYHRRSQAGELGQVEAQELALRAVENLRYGENNLDYFWISDASPRMLMHPYAKELEGEDLAQYTDADGKVIFLEFVRRSEGLNDGYLHHTWHTKYQEQQTVPKLSYVKRFQPWGWIIGTGIFLDDVQRTKAELTERLSRLAFMALCALSLLLALICYQSMRLDRRRQSAEHALARSREKYKLLVESGSEPVMLLRDSECLYASRAMLAMVGHSLESLQQAGLKQVFGSSWHELLKNLQEGEAASQAEWRELTLVAADGQSLPVQIHVQNQGMDGGKVQVVLIRPIQDLSPLQERLKILEKQLGETARTNAILASPVGDFSHPLPMIPAGTKSQEMVELLLSGDARAVILADEAGGVAAVVDRERLVAASSGETGSMDTASLAALAVEVACISRETTVYEAVQMLQGRGDLLLVAGSRGEAPRGFWGALLWPYLYRGPQQVLDEMSAATTISQVNSGRKEFHEGLYLQAVSGIRTTSLLSQLSSCSLVVMTRVMAISLAECGQPPCRFALLSLGSEGRGEQTLATDQDNALLYEDVGADEEAVHSYFSKLAARFCDLLDQAGYRRCSGGFMAANPHWCQSLSAWQAQFRSWIADPEPQRLLEAGIFFDMTCRYGDQDLVEELQASVTRMISSQPPFLYLMAEHTMLYKIPLSFFGNIEVETEGKQANTINIKHVMSMFVNYARVLALAAGIEAVQTRERFRELGDKGQLSVQFVDELLESYDFLMEVRLRHQVSQLRTGEEVDNHLALSELGVLQTENLKRCLHLAGSLQKRILQSRSGSYF